jgi:hypothetical protein
MIQIKPPNPINVSTYRSFFLAGSIEMGKAEDWQKNVVSSLEDYAVTILNPRRDNWDSTWLQSIDSPQFKEQVEWELSGIEQVTDVIMYFAPGTLSPISLLELGLILGRTGDDLYKTQKIWVCCPHGFYRKGNIDITCNRYDVNVWEDLNVMLKDIKMSLLERLRI